MLIIKCKKCNLGFMSNVHVVHDVKYEITCKCCQQSFVALIPSLVVGGVYKDNSFPAYGMVFEIDKSRGCFGYMYKSISGISKVYFTINGISHNHLERVCDPTIIHSTKTSLFGNALDFNDAVGNH